MSINQIVDRGGRRENRVSKKSEKFRTELIHKRYRKLVNLAKRIAYSTKSSNQDSVIIELREYLENIGEV